MIDNTPNTEALERMEAEYEALTEKLEKLKEFLLNEWYTTEREAYSLLSEQHQHMYAYAGVLHKRIQLMQKELAEAEAEKPSTEEQFTEYGDVVAEAIKTIPTPEGTELYKVNIKLKRTKKEKSEDFNFEKALDEMGFVVLNFRELF